MRKAPYWKQKAVQKKITRNALASEQDGRCYYCRSLMGLDATIEHVRPRSRGGPDVETNMKAACRLCNYTRGNMPHGEFWKQIKGRHSPDDMSVWVVWMRRKLSLRTERAIRRINRFVGNVD